MAGLDFEAFFGAHFDAVARAIALATGSRELAADATQEAFTKTYSHWRRVRQMDRPDGWVYVVAMNIARRKQRREQRTPRPELAIATDPVGAVSTKVAVRDAIATLPPRQREAVVLRYLADLPLADVADAMGSALGTAKATLHQALKALRIEFEETDNED